MLLTAFMLFTKAARAEGAHDHLAGATAIVQSGPDFTP